MRALLSGILFSVAATARVAAAAELTLEDSYVGLGGFAAEKTFSPIWVQVRNDGEEPYDGPLTLQPVNPTGGVRASVSRTTYLLPGETRWERLTPYTAEQSSQYRLLWEGGETDLPMVTTRRRPIAALVADATDLGRQGRARLPGIPARFFPRRVTELDGLGVLVVTAGVSLQPPQEAALRDWVSLGGVVAVSGSTGPFGGGLAFLDRPETVSRFLAGTVLRLPFDPATATDEEVRALVRNALRADAVDAVADRPQRGVRARPYLWDVDQDIGGALLWATTPRSLTLGLIIPVFGYGMLLWVLGRRAARRKWTAGGMIAATLIAAVVTTILVDRTSPLSGDAAAATMTITFARPLPDADAGEDRPPRVDVRQWAVYREAVGGQRRVAPRGEGALITYASVGTDGGVRDGPSQTAVSVAAPRSNVLVRVRGVVRAVPPDVRIRRFDRLDRLQLSVDGPTTDRPRFRGGTAQYRDRIVRLSPYLLGSGRAVTLAEFFGFGTINVSARSWFLGDQHPKDRLTEVAGKAVILDHRTAGLVEPHDLTLPPDVLRIHLVEELREGPVEDSVDLLPGVAGGIRMVVWTLDLPVRGGADRIGDSSGNPLDGR